MVEGIGYDFLPKTLDRKIVDKWIKTDDKDAFQMARRLNKEEGLLCGGSSGAAMWGALQEAKNLKAGQKCLVILPDNIRNYMTKFISDQWMEVRGFKPIIPNDKLCWWGAHLTQDVVSPVCVISHRTPTAEALATLQQSGALVAAIVNEKGSLSGVFTADNARRRLTNLSGCLSEDLEKFLVKKFYKVDLINKPTLAAVSRVLDIAPYVVVVKTDTAMKIQKPLGVVTSEDLLNHVMSTGKQVNGK